MKGVIILPQYLEKHWTPKHVSDFGNVLSVTAPFFYAIKDTFGFELRYANEVDVSVNIDVVVMFGVPYHNRPNLIPGLLDLDKKTKLIMYSGDLQCYDNTECFENRIKVYERCDLILYGSYEYFIKTYNQFVSKYEFMNLFFSPHKRYARLSLNENPKMRCLLSGAVNNKVYPLRYFIKNNAINVDHKRSEYVGNRYAELLNSYFCCVTSSSVFNYAVAKYFEIPAAGSLLIADEVNDLKRAGFVPNKHYVPITRSNVIKRISHCLKNPNDYNHIRIQGMKFVRENHSVINRIDRLKKIFKELVV
jgi:hypothetical protein